ncbi:MAG: adenylosuccinate lyase [Candidatus Taylorbacteria bacterium CG11_big_fil_rev_8_21_14_0_20_46_11]|uniref:Adenylosuccinate lyase n=1 Tax=Candidatus Taylorbacteria bacterium CG11_big_fil_rev_8_21_14_0_20_46_11 TaxID=1975025 RepID=A0A2H0K9X7_9BACT|nr:MAG: adenylosuccinate lyase [Candidatus Taylorbacteria bacterium CG11_big_fil_rev_8_21_14_0_20_46_11]
MQIDTLDALCPLDGRYRKKVQALSSAFSERGLMTRRTLVEIDYLCALSDHPRVPLRKFTVSERRYMRTLQNISLPAGRIIKRIELEGYQGRHKTNHDVKAIEFYIQSRLKECSLQDITGWIHFALTSEDVNNIAYALQLRDGLESHLLPAFGSIQTDLCALSGSHALLAMLARTHGQPASPTTFGKEMSVFEQRLSKELDALRTQKIRVKLNGASGNYHAHHASLPHVDWVQFTKDFVARLNDGDHTVQFEPNLMTTQVEPHDTYAQLFDALKRICVILASFCEDMWRYISDNWVVQRAVAGEIGSSVMPHKVNPINFENAEGNLNLAVTLCEFFARQLPRMRLQRHLSDSTVIRNFGVVFGHMLLASMEIRTGLGKIAPNPTAMKRALQAHPEVIAEAYQTILRREGLPDPYKQLSDFTRGKEISLKALRGFARKLKVSSAVQKELLAFTPSNYTGMAAKLALLEGVL